MPAKTNFSFTACFRASHFIVALLVFAATQSTFGQTYDLNVTCPSDRMVARVNTCLFGVCRVNDRCDSSCNDQQHPRLITPQEMLADLNYKLDNQFEVVFADQEKVLEQIVQIQDGSARHDKSLAELLSKLESIQKVQTQRAVFLQALTGSIEDIGKENSRSNSELSAKIDSHAKAYRNHLNKVTQNTQASEKRLMTEIDKTFSVLGSVSEKLVGVAKQGSENSTILSEFIKKTHSQMSGVQKEQSRANQRMNNALKQLDSMRSDLEGFTNNTEEQIQKLAREQKAYRDQVAKWAKGKAAAVDSSGLGGLKKQLKEHAEKTDGMLRALEHDLTSLNERMSNLEKAEQKRQKQLLQRLSRLDEIEARLANLEPKKGKKKK